MQQTQKHTNHSCSQHCPFSIYCTPTPHTDTAPTLRPTPTALHNTSRQKRRVSHVHLGSGGGPQRPFGAFSSSPVSDSQCVWTVQCVIWDLFCAFQSQPALPWTTWQTSALPSRKSALLSTRRTASARWGKSRSCCVSTMRISSASTTFSGHGTLTTWGMCILLFFYRMVAHCICLLFMHISPFPWTYFNVGLENVSHPCEGFIPCFRLSHRCTVAIEISSFN